MLVMFPRHRELLARIGVFVIDVGVGIPSHPHLDFDPSIGVFYFHRQAVDHSHTPRRPSQTAKINLPIQFEDLAEINDPFRHAVTLE